MRTFKDNAGRTWTIAMNVWAAKRVKDLAGVDLLGEPGEAMSKMATDGMTLCNTVYAIVKPEADKAGVTDEQFGEAMGGEAMRIATDAMLEELVDFFRQYRPALGTTVAATLAKLREVEPAAAKLAMAKLDAMDVQALVGNLSTDAPAS